MTHDHSHMGTPHQHEGAAHFHEDATHEDAVHTHDDAAHTHSHGGHTHTHTQTKKVLDRLSRAIGHLTAVRTMVENGRDCAEVLVQLAAVRSALNSTSRVILKDHLDHCIVDAVKTGDTDALDELNRAIELLMK